ncbi:acyl-CoA dehydrogenase, C-terminal domain protein [Phascolarctobacterium succinatutens YIT 12067]|jgi:alkylation response protein AidB-like acyl-CoA dehydrogenase|uniref:Acyl-CoA dehydrogenase, C-terminal domain protein n=6 Tax=Phascolarctobacterium succinatutens TaxID=626940 RepID=E8LB57_9FIRM|nr:acyl-CoA dehydrogenase family protein [Phascolarctobacterium succinatutens]EFY05927.1 acyl-CoA dehydrogenase, C-terminal domain protein [Phascolarctobacterium succinatutens YIT 12067]
MMDFALNEEQLELQEMVREFVEKEITPYAAEMDAENHMRDGLIDKANEMGLLNVIVPEELDGPGLDSISVATIYEELGKGCAGVATSLAANSLATVPVLLAGTDEQKKMYCDILNNGGLAAFALTEPGAGSDAGGVSTRAVHNKEEGTYTLNGTKMFITNGGLAEIFLVFANTRKTGGIRGLTAFIVPKDTPGFSVGKKENKMGIRPSNTTELVLQDVVIPESYRVGREGEGFRIAMNTLDSARPFVGAVSVGIAQAALDCAVKYAKERRQFGQPIASFQMVQGMLADMAMKVETARLMVQKACWMRDQGMEFSKEAAMAKCYAADTAMQVTTDAVQVMGGYGYTKEYPVEKMMRDAKIMQIYEGTNQIQRLVIANKLLY